ncbi:TPA: hypothetical protein I7721_21410 [Vibrio vulnificus]|nr:hypothetical protein [Vibrio vulnificus]
MWINFVLRDRAGKAAHRCNKNHGCLSAEARRQAVRKGQKMRNPTPLPDGFCFWRTRSNKNAGWSQTKGRKSEKDFSPLQNKGRQVRVFT